MSEPSKPLVMGAGPRLPMPQLRDLSAAFALLTPILAAPPINSDAFARATLFFPVVGVAVGAVLICLQHGLAAVLPTWLVAPLLVVAWCVFTFPTSAPRQADTGSVWAIAALWVVKLVAVAALAHGLDAALLFAPLLGRWSIVVLAIGARAADHPGRKFNPSIAFREFGWTSAFTGAVLAGYGDAVGILIFIAAAAFILGIRLLQHRFFGGVTWVSLCLSLHLVETLLLIALSAL